MCGSWSVHIPTFPPRGDDDDTKNLIGMSVHIATIFLFSSTEVALAPMLLSKLNHQIGSQLVSMDGHHRWEMLAEERVQCVDWDTYTYTNAGVIASKF